MCYTYEVSRDAFIIGIISSLILFKKSKKYEYKIIALFLMFVSLMQLYDAIFWKNPPTTDEKKKINEKYTKIAMYSNHLQPLVLAGLILYYKGGLLPISKQILLAYIIVMILYNSNALNKIKYTEVTSESSPSLYWEWNNLKGSNILYFLYIILYIILFSKEIGGSVGIIGVILTLASLLYSFVKYKNKNSTGRFWCYFAAFCPLIFLI
jgi:hypothetical protein